MTKLLDWFLKLTPGLIAAPLACWLFMVLHELLNPYFVIREEYQFIPATLICFVLGFCRPKQVGFIFLGFCIGLPMCFVMFFTPWAIIYSQIYYFVAAVSLFAGAAFRLVIHWLAWVTTVIWAFCLRRGT